jgi:hypothetical protein
VTVGMRGKFGRVANRQIGSKLQDRDGLGFSGASDWLRVGFRL